MRPKNIILGSDRARQLAPPWGHRCFCELRPLAVGRKPIVPGEDRMRANSRAFQYTHEPRLQ
jgi:hypothetical protein